MTITAAQASGALPSVLSPDPGPSFSILDVLGAVDRPLELPCRRVDPELFFAESPADVEAAKAVCAACPVRAACLAGARERREPWGVWGGELFVQGVVVARKRPRGRPRKHPLPEPAYAPAARSEAAA